MEYIHDFTNIYIPAVISCKTEALISSGKLDSMVILVSSRLNASYARMIAVQLGWDAEIQSQGDNYSIRACKM